MKISNNFKLILILIAFLILITMLTKFEGEADIYDYSDSAKFFAGKYYAKIRSSHSHLYGLIHSPFVWLFESFWIFKITSLISLLLIVYSAYIISGKNKNVLWLMILSPIIWYMAPWISPIQLSSLLFLWGWYFIRKYENKKNVLDLFYSGALIGLSWAFWDAILFFVPLLIVSFLYNRKLAHALYFLGFFLVGSIPRLILDHILFGTAFFGAMRHIMASFALTLIGGFYGQGGLWGLIDFVLTIIFLPLFTYLLFKKEVFMQNRKSALFIFLSIILLILNSQIRFVLLIFPIIILITSRYLTRKKFIFQITFSFILILIVLNPYIMQISGVIGENYKGIEFNYFIKYLGNINMNNLDKGIIKNDIANIANDYPNETFIVGNYPDDYRILASLYWRKNVHEFVSIEDYRLSFSEDPIIAKKELCSDVKITERRDVCFSIWIRKAFNDETNYDSIKYAISDQENFDLEDFRFIKKYGSLYVFEKV